MSKLPKLTESELEFAPPQFIAWMNEQSFSVQYSDIRTRQLEGTFPGDPTLGVWTTSAARVMAGWGSIFEKDWPECHDISKWPPPEPDGLDEKAKQLRSLYYHRVRSITDCLLTLGLNMPVAALFEITDDWYNAEYGIIRLPEEGKPIVGSHTVSIEGVDFGRMCFLFTNSWGGEWGNNGRGFMSFQFFQKYFVEAYVHHGLGQEIPKTMLEGLSGIVDFASGHPDYLTIREPRSFGAPIHIREFFDIESNERIAWAIAVHRDGFIDIEELFVKPIYRTQGYGKNLTTMILELSSELKLPVRIWIPFSDWNHRDAPGVRAIAKMLGLKLFWSEVAWSPVVGILDDQECRKKCFRKVPEEVALDCNHFAEV